MARIDINGEKSFGEFLVVSDGTNLFVYFPADNRYTRSAPDPEGGHIHTFVAEPIDDFFRPNTIGVKPAAGPPNYLGKETADDTEYDVVEVVVPAPLDRTIRYFMSPKDHLVHRVVITTQRKSGQTTTSWVRLKNI